MHYEKVYCIHILGTMINDERRKLRNRRLFSCKGKNLRALLLVLSGIYVFLLVVISLLGHPPPRSMFGPSCHLDVRQYFIHSVNVYIIPIMFL